MNLARFLALSPIDLRAGLPYGHRQPIGTSDHKTSITVHYAGTAEPGADTDAGALAQIASEARYHIGKVWGYYDAAHRQPIFGDGIMYHVAVLPSGRPAWLRNFGAVLYHAGNTTANATSIAVTTLRGVGQPISALQWAGVVAVCDALRLDYGMGTREVVKAHREWPRTDGRAQSICPGPIVYEQLLGYRQALATVPAPLPTTGTPAAMPTATGTYEVIAPAGVSVREGPNVAYPRALGGTLAYPKGKRFQCGRVLSDDRGMHRVWLWDASGVGFVAGDPELVRYVGGA